MFNTPEAEIRELLKRVSDERIKEEVSNRGIEIDCDCDNGYDCECVVTDFISSPRTIRNLIREVSDFLRDNKKNNLALALDDLAVELRV